jgi:hypothetical protein
VVGQARVTDSCIFFEEKTRKKKVSGRKKDGSWDIHLQFSPVSQVSIIQVGFFLNIFNSM